MTDRGSSGMRNYRIGWDTVRGRALGEVPSWSNVHEWHSHETHDAFVRATDVRGVPH